jgi:hypothetical protein
MEVFLLTIDYSSPLFAGFDGFDDESSLLGTESIYDVFKPENSRLLRWKPREFGEKWQPRSVFGPVRPFNDFPRMGIYTLMFSQRAVDALRCFLGDNGELLPLKSNVGAYYAFNLRKKSTAFNSEKSKFTVFKGMETSNAIDFYSFHETKLKNHSIFRLKESPTGVYVTDRFRARVEQASLNGFDFVKVWPLPRGVSWVKEDTARKRGRVKTQSDLQGQSMHIKLKIGGKSVSVAEMKMSKTIYEKVRSFLANQKSISDPYLGTIESTDQDNDDLIIVLSCPDVDALALAIQPLLVKARWLNKVKLVKRYGTFWQNRLKEVTLSIR